MTYDSGVTFDADTITDDIKEADTKKKEGLQVICPFFSYLIKDHKALFANKFRYNGIQTEAELNDTINGHLSKIIYRSTMSVINTHLVPMIPKSLLQTCVLRGVQWFIILIYEHIFLAKH